MFTDIDSPLQPYAFEQYDGLCVGIMGNTLIGQQLERFAQDNGFSYTTKEFSSSGDLQPALAAGEIDAAILVSYVATENTRILAKFSPAPIYIVTTKGNSKVLAGLNQAINYFKISNLYFEASLYQKYYVEAESMELTKAEQAIVEASQNAPIRVGVIDNCAPISYLNSKSNAYEGLTVEIFNSICAKTGLCVEYVPVDLSRRNETTAPIDSSPQLVLGVPLVQGVQDDRGWNLSAPLLEVPLAIAGRGDTALAWGNDNLKIAVVKDFAMARTYIEEYLPESKIIEYATLEDCMTAVADGAADATVYYQSCITYFQQKPYFRDLKLVPVSMTGTSLCAAGFTEESKLLLQIIDKGLGRISENELRSLTLNITMLNSYPMTFGDAIYEFRLPLIVIGFLLAAVIAVLFALYSVKRKNSRKLAEAYRQEKRGSRCGGECQCCQG